MKIAYVTDVVYPFVKGGAEKRIYEVGKRLATENEVHIFGIKWWHGRDSIIVDGINIHGVCKPLELYANQRRSFNEALKFALSLTPMLKYDFDVIDCNQFPYLHCFPTRLISTIKRTAMIITWHEVWGDYWFEYLGKIGLIGKVIERLSVNLADRIVAVSESTKQSLKNLTANISVIPNGTDLDFIGSVKPSITSFDVLFVGRLIPDKHVDVLLRSVPLGKSIGIIGKGPEKERLTRLANELHVRATFDSDVKYDELIGLMKSAETLVLPSSREGFGVVALEALASGTPVITTNCERNSAKDLIKNGINGFVVDLSPDSLKSAILNINKADMCQAAQDSARDYDWATICKKIFGVYQSLIN